MHYDPFDDHIQEDPYPTYRWLRAEAPVYRNDRLDFWTLSRFDDVLAAAHDPARFSSVDAVLLGERSEAMPPMMITMDPPHHDELRRIVSRSFTPRAIGQLQARVRSIAAELLDRLGESSSPVEMVEAFTVPLPVMVIADLLGVAREDRARFKEWSDIVVAMDPADPASMEASMGAGFELAGYFEQIAAARREAPQDDLVTLLVQAQDAGLLRYEEVLGFCLLLLIAGNETTTNLIGNGLIVLAAHPDQRAEIAADRSLIPRAIEEVLRYDSPVQGLTRKTTTEVELHGETLPVGAQVMLLWASANRDEREYQRPDEFDIHREISRTVAFGHGIHYCLGAALARLEARVAFEELLDRFPEWSVDRPVEWIRSGPVRGPERLHVALGT